MLYIPINLFNLPPKAVRLCFLKIMPRFLLPHFRPQPLYRRLLRHSTSSNAFLRKRFAPIPDTFVGDPRCHLNAPSWSITSVRDYLRRVCSYIVVSHLFRSFCVTFLKFISIPPNVGPLVSELHSVVSRNPPPPSPPHAALYNVHWILRPRQHHDD